MKSSTNGIRTGTDGKGRQWAKHFDVAMHRLTTSFLRYVADRSERAVPERQKSIKGKTFGIVFTFKTMAIKYLLICLLLLSFCACSGQKFRERSPNVVVILTDDQGWGDLSYSGNTNISTPNIDALARSGASFEHFFVSPVCSPTRAEFLTGRYNPRCGVYSTSAGGERLDLDETTIAEVFLKAGYQTAAYGKWHNGMQPPYHPNARGFGDFYGFCSGHWGDYFSPMLEHNGKLVTGNGYVVDDFTDHALHFIDSNVDAPFFLYLPYNTPHSPMQVPDRWYGPFEDKAIVMRHRDPEKEDVQFTRAALAMVENIDWNVGRIIRKIESRGLLEHTIFVFFSDNGPNSWRWNGGMKGRKGSTDEGGVRSPLFLSWKGVVQPATTVPDIAASIDLLPTLADLADIDLHTNNPIDGISLVSFLRKEEGPVPERYIFNHWNGKTSVRSQRYRLDHQERLFDMEKDPGQRIPLNVAVPEVAGRMIVAKRNWEQEILGQLDIDRRRPFPVGCPGFELTQLPARDGVAYGSIQRSNRWPNCSFYTNWRAVGDSISWYIDVMEEGFYEAELYYTCAAKNLGSTIALSYGGQSIVAKVTEAHDPPLKGMQHDRIPRQESYVKDFMPWSLGQIYLEKGTGPISIKALHIPGEFVLDLRLIMLKKR